MKRRICSYDMAAVPEDCYALSEVGGEMYFCNSRCLFLWAGTFVTKPAAPESKIDGVLQMAEPNGQVRKFDSLLDVAQWAAANALQGWETAWYAKGRKLDR